MAGIDIKGIMIKANKKLSFALLGFLLLIPVIWVLTFLDIMPYTRENLIVISISVFILSVAPFLVNKNFYNEFFISSCNLYCLELLLLMIAFNPIVDVNFVYFILPVVSFIYFNRTILHRMSLLAFVGMLLVKGSKLGYFAFSGLESGSELNPRYIDIAITTLELIILCIILIKVYEIMEDTLSQSNSAAMMEMYMASGQTPSGQPAYTSNRPDEKTKAEVGDTYDVQQFFAAIVTDMEALIRGKEKHFSLDLDNRMPVALFGQKTQLRSALISICSDLLMYSVKSEVNVYVTYDNGINPRKKDNITMIIRIDSSTDLGKNAVDKKALGYFLSKRIMDELDGDLVEVHDEDGKVAYKIRLLQRVENDLTIAERSEKQRSESLELRQKSIFNKAEEISGRLFHKDVHVMVVDDNKENRKLLDSVLSAAGVKVTTVKNGVECIEQLKGQDYQMVLIDQMMPDKSGTETLKEIRFQENEYFQKLPIVMMTVHSEDDKTDYKNLGFTDCISKPISVTEVKSCLQRWIKDDYRMTYEEYVRMQNEEAHK